MAIVSEDIGDGEIVSGDTDNGGGEDADNGGGEDADNGGGEDADNGGDEDTDNGGDEDADNSSCKTLFFLNILVNLNLHLIAYFAQKTLAMQATVSRQNHAQNLLSVVIFMLIICYYAFNGIPQDTFETKKFLIENAEQNKTAEFQKSLNQLRAAVLMDSDAVQINGLLYEVENASENFINRKKAKIAVHKIHDRLLLGEKQRAIRLINELPMLFLK